MVTGDWQKPPGHQLVTIELGMKRSGWHGPRWPRWPNPCISSQICIHGRSEAHAEKWHNGWQRFMCFMMWPSCHCMHPPHLTCLSRCDPNLHPFFRTHGCGALPGHPCLTTFKAPLSLSRRYADRHRHDTPPTVAPNSKPYLGIDDRR